MLPATTFSRQPMRIGIVGHRFIPMEAATRFVRDNCGRILSGAKSQYPKLVALSALAEGADSIFAEAAIRATIPLEIVCPFEDYPADFTTPESKDIYTSLRSAAVSEQRLVFAHRSEDAYYAGMRWVIDQADLLIAVWDGEEGRGIGGTSHAVKQAKEKGLDWIHLDITTLTVKSHCR